MLVDKLKCFFWKSVVVCLFFLRKKVRFSDCWGPVLLLRYMKEECGMCAIGSVTYARSKKCLLRSLLRCMKKVRVTS